MCRHRASLTPFPSSSSTYNTFTLHNYTFTHPKITSFCKQIPHVTWSAREERESKIDHTNAIYPHIAEPEAGNSAVGWR